MRDFAFDDAPHTRARVVAPRRTTRTARDARGRGRVVRRRARRADDDDDAEFERAVEFRDDDAARRDGDARAATVRVGARGGGTNARARDR